MNKADIICRLHELADFQLLGGGSWPANRESVTSCLRMLKEMGLSEDVPEVPGDTRTTALGWELNVDLMAVFAGVWDIFDIPFVLESAGYLERDEERAIWENSTEAEANRRIHGYVLRAYHQFCNHSRFRN
jgi:hypothetical protein